VNLDDLGFPEATGADAPDIIKIPNTNTAPPQKENLTPGPDDTKKAPEPKQTPKIVELS